MNDLIRRDEAIKEIEKYAEIYAKRQTTDSSQYYVGKEDGCYSAIYVLEVMKPVGHSTNKKDMEALIGDINAFEIASHIETDTLRDWCKIIRHEMLCTLDKMETVEPKTGHWEQERIISVEDAQVSMLQLATCPNCKRIHTTPYRYCFEEYAYCPKCGAKMGGNEDER